MFIIKKTIYFAIPVFIILLITYVLGCKNDNKAEETQKNTEVTNQYSKEEVISNDYIVYEDNKLISGKEIWDEFIEKTSYGQEAAVSVATIIDNQILTTRLVYNEAGYFCNDEEPWENGTNITKQYKYIKEITGIVEASGITEHLIILTNNNDITYEEILKGIESSQSKDIYSDNHYVVTYMTTIE